jgi:molecular chaperone DnaK
MAHSSPHQTRKSLTDLGENFDAAEKAGIEAAIEDLETVLKDDSASKEQIEEKVKALTEKSHKMTEAMYAKEQGGANPEAKKADDDDVIDAEVE